MGTTDIIILAAWAIGYAVSFGVAAAVVDPYDDTPWPIVLGAWPLVIWWVLAYVIAKRIKEARLD